MHHRHALDDAQRNIHVVLDDDVADMRRQRGQDLDQLEPLGRRQPGRRLVEQDEARRARERERDLELALLAMGELGNQRCSLTAVRCTACTSPSADCIERVARRRGRSSEKRPRETPQQAR